MADPRRTLPPMPPACADLATGRPVVLTSEGPLGRRGAVVVAARDADAAQITFMAVQARGLVCLALPQARIDRLGIGMQPRTNRKGPDVFAVSIEARDGVSTGISAADRARTVRVAVDPACGPDDIATPGHVFPVAAARGGVLARPGQPEAAVDLARLAGAGEAAVLCDILGPEGDLAGADGIDRFADAHGLCQISLQELICHRQAHDPLLRQTCRGMVELLGGGRWELRQFEDRDTGLCHSVLTLGAVEMQRETPVFVGRDQMPPGQPGFVPTRDFGQAVARIRAAGGGVIVLLNGAAGAGGDQRPGGPPQREILRRLGVQRVRLLDLSRPDAGVGVGAAAGAGAGAGASASAGAAGSPISQIIDGGWR